MRQSELYRRKAEQAEARAKSITDPVIREQFQDMAAHWRHLAALAQEAERRSP